MRSATPSKGMAKFGGMDVSDARTLETLEDEDARPKGRWQTRSATPPC
ncbi:MAG: hypothetical protein AAGA32_14720 [Pseudomonadota bacterium]